MTVQTKSQSPFKGLCFSAFNYCLFTCLAAKKIKGKKEILQIFVYVVLNFNMKIPIFQVVLYFKNLGNQSTCQFSALWVFGLCCKRAESSGLSFKPIVSRARVA